MARADLTGRRFGDLEVIGPAAPSPSGERFWTCRCHRCGGTKRIRGVYLTGPRHYTDCGCRWAERKADLTGRTMGALEVLELLPERKREQKAYRVRCRICGKESTALQHRLLQEPESCGCQASAWMATDYGRQVGRDASQKAQYNGSHVFTANGTDPKPGNTTGFRWVRWYERNKCYAYTFTVAKQRYFRMGYDTPEEAHAAAVTAHKAAMKEHGIPTVKAFRAIRNKETER